MVGSCFGQPSLGEGVTAPLFRARGNSFSEKSYEQPLLSQHGWEVDLTVAYQVPAWSWLRVCAKSLQLCSALCNYMDHSLPGSSVHGILQARIVEWVAMPSYRESF